MNDRDFDPSALATAARSRALFDRAVSQIDPATVNRLRRMRRDALSGGSRFAPRPMRAMALLASCLVLIGLAWWLPRGAGPSPGSAIVAADNGIGIPVDDDQEALYAWLGDAPVAVEAQPGDSL